MRAWGCRVFSRPRCLPRYASPFPTWLTNVFRPGRHWRSSQLGGRELFLFIYFFSQIPQIGSPALISILTKVLLQVATNLIIIIKKNGAKLLKNHNFFFFFGFHFLEKQYRQVMKIRHKKKKFLKRDLALNGVTRFKNLYK
jgi:hypothetical protein